MLALFADRVEPKRAECAPLAGKSTLNRLEHAPLRPDDRYHKIDHDPQALANLFIDLFLEAEKWPPKRIMLDLDATDDPLHGDQEGRFFHGYYSCYCYLPLYVFQSAPMSSRFRRSPPARRVAGRSHAQNAAAHPATKPDRGNELRPNGVKPYLSVRYPG